MPKLGVDMQEGEIIEWKKQEGDVVNEGDILLEIMSDKTNMELEAEDSGVLLKITRQAGETVPVTEVIGYIGAEGEVVADNATSAPVAEATAQLESAGLEVPKAPAQAAPAAVAEKAPLADNEYDIIVVGGGRREERLKELAEECKDLPGELVWYAGDVGDPETAVGMVKKAVETFGKLDVAVNDAGIMDDNTAIADLSDEMLHETFRINTFGLMYGMREECRQYLAQGEGGVIVNICSVGATHQTSGAAYCASKGAVLAATKNTAFMYMEEGIRCNAVSPGGVVTDIPLVMPPSDEFGFSRTSKLLDFSGELAMPEDLADAILFLASDQSRYVNGEELKCDGGWTCF